jgi:hypothetical protein
MGEEGHKQPGEWSLGEQRRNFRELFERFRLEERR